MATYARHPLPRVVRDLRLESDAFTKRLFARLFAMNPALRELFPAGMTAHREVFFQVLEHVFLSIPEADQRQDLVEFLAQLGRDHRKYGLTEADYATMTVALIAEVRDTYTRLGGLTADEDLILEQATRLMTGVMNGGAQSDPTPARRTAQVVAVMRPHPGLTVVRLIADEPLLFRPGQYVETQIPQVPRQWRSFSLAMPPNTQGQIEFHIRAVSNGDLSNAIHNETRPGDVWVFGQVHGLMRPHLDRPITMVAGGTGLAPMKSMLLAMATGTNNPDTHLVVGARSPGLLYDADALTTLAATNPWLRVTQVTDSRRDPWWLHHPSTAARALPLRHGSVIDALAGTDLTGHRVLIAGPVGMIRTVKSAARRAGADPALITHDPL